MSAETREVEVTYGISADQWNWMSDRPNMLGQMLVRMVDQLDHDGGDLTALKLEATVHTTTPSTELGAEPTVYRAVVFQMRAPFGRRVL